MRKSDEIIDRERDNIFQTYKRYPIAVRKASGCKIYSVDGGEYLDFLSGIAVCALGHGNPKIVKAAMDQMMQYSHVSNYFYQTPQIELAEKLNEISGFERVFFSNSGAEAVEGALKLARRYGAFNGKSQIAAFRGGFHGRTYGALSIMDKPAYKAKMEPFLPDVRIIDYNDVDALEKSIDEDVAAVFVELIQGEGGIAEANEDFIANLLELRKKYEFLIVADEIQTGMGRTGKYFAYQHYDFQPDVCVVAKALGGGLPLGAIMASDYLSKVFEPGMHGSTFGGAAIACAAGKVVVTELQNWVLKNVAVMAKYLDFKLESVREKHPDKVAETRGRGLMRGLKLNFDVAVLVEKLLEKRIVTNAAAGNVLRILPPLIASHGEIDEFIQGLNASLAEIDA